MKIGEIVERNIEGTWFTAEIKLVDLKQSQVDLVYLDDGNLEKSVPLEDVRVASIESKNNITPRSGKFDTLPKPLLGLVDDDSETRKAHAPTIVLHKDSDEDRAILMNGAENKLAAGGGIRALRYLKK
eukprot:gene7392-10073_t